jgi:uncharacterized protein YcfJ
MKKAVVIVTLLSFMVSLYGCETLDQNGRPDAGRSAAGGAAMGTLLGGVVGAAAGGGKAKNVLLGAALGALIGGAAGYIYGREREREYKSAEQIYREDPVLARRSSANMPPRITGMVPTIKNEQDMPVRVLKGGQRIKLGMRYDIKIPLYSNIKEVKVVETNTLTSPNGAVTDARKLTRIKTRPCKGVDADQEVTIPENSPEGIYLHQAVVQLGGEKYVSQRKIQMVKVDGKMNFYATN